MRRWLGTSLLLLVAGCGPASVADQPSPTPPPKANPQPTKIVPPVKPVVEAAPAPKPPITEPGQDQLTNIGTRKAGVDWPTFLGPTGDSKSPETGIITKWPATGPRIVWQRKLGEGYGIGSISQGRIYQADRIDGDAQLVCLNAETGEELWKHSYPTDYVDKYGYDGGPRCSPIVDGNRVYMLGVEGWLHCYRADNGDVIWKKHTSKEFGVVQNFFGVGSTPVIEGDLLIAMIGGSAADSDPGAPENADPNGTAIVAFNKFTGEVVYKFGDELASYASLKLSTIKGRRWCFAFCRGGLMGFEPSKGKLDFHYPWRAKNPESVNASMPVVVDNEVFISETYGPGSSLLEVMPGDAKVVWADDLRMRMKAMQTHWNTPVHVDGYVYGSSGRNTENAELRCVEWKTGKVMWSEADLTRGSLLAVDGHFVLLGEYGQLQLLKIDPKKYNLVAEAILPAPGGGGLLAPPSLLKYPCWAAPVLSHGLLYVRGAERLVCLELIPAKADAR